MYKTLGAVVFVAALALTGCTPHSYAAPPPAPSTPPVDAPTPEPTSPTVTPNLDDVFLATIAERYPGKEQVYKSLAVGFCGYIDEVGGDFGTAFTNSVHMATDAGMNAYDFGYVTGAGVIAYCPQYTEAMLAYSKAATGG
jgi:hypothetical protein